MLRAAIIFFVLALVSLIFGATGFAGLSAEIGKTLLVVFLILSALSLVVNLFSQQRTKRLP
ncbi:MAG: DUF1328 domain-containing protein [Bdellovibrionales bacterium CG10_big_fil_rev_8_21_14_0_10_45_34]|nr:MAG: DUF1328 domain-containing protein [Bdellovibrionales bacterium CG10_big_fil_rev_8_21_14_0_10_45_34]